MQHTLVFLLAGQSNMSGRGDLESVPAIRDERILVSREGRLSTAEEPLHRDPHAAIGPGMSFAETVLDRFDCERVVLVPCAVGGTWIERWSPGADLFVNALSEAREALRHGSLGGILWHQGEADAATPTSSSAYAEELRGVVDGFRVELGEAAAPFVAGETGEFLQAYPGCPYSETVNSAIRALRADKSRYAVATSKGLGHTGDHLHFDAASARVLGRRYAEAWLDIVMPAQ